MSTSRPLEDEPLLGHDSSKQNGVSDGDRIEEAHLRGPNRSPAVFLPVSFLASMGMATTVATTIFAYASLLCADPINCDAEEQSKYAAVVAVANGVAHIAATLALGPLERLSKKHLKAGLAVWIVCRAMSIIVLVIGVALHNIWVALAGRLFEGLASDNLLHFNLNTIYVSSSTEHPQHVSRLIETSLGLYLLGAAVAPLALTIFPSYAASFIVALSFFALTLAYTFICPSQPPTDAGPTQPDAKTQMSFGGMLSPLKPFLGTPHAIFHGASLLLYTTVQAHLFPMIMVFASVRFGFDGFHNGLLVSIAALCAAVQLFVALYLIPLITSRRQPDDARPTNDRESRNHAVLGMVAQMVALSFMSWISTPTNLYLTVVLASSGLLVSSFVKSEFVALMPEPGPAIAALAMMESIGGMVSPFVLGAWQMVFPGQSVFAFTVGLLGLSMGLLVTGSLALHKRPKI